MIKSLENIIHGIGSIRMSALSIGAGIGLSLLTLLAPNARADTHYVSTNGLHQAPYTLPENAATNIQSAVDVAEDGDKVQISDGAYYVAPTNGITWNASSPAKHITIASENGAQNCIIDCQSKGRGFTFDSGQTTNDAIEGLTITNGYSMWTRTGDSSKLWGGGGIFVSNSSPRISSCTITHCTAKKSPYSSFYADGGGIAMIGGSPIIENCVIENNTGTHTGGGIHVENSSPDIKNNYIAYNYNQGCYGGGGISFITSTGGKVTGNLIVHNLAHYYTTKGGFGGGILTMNSNPTIENNTIAYNDTTLPSGDPVLGEGGGIRIRGLPTPVMNNNMFYGNIATNGLEDLDIQYPSYTIDLNNSLIGSGSTNFICPDRESNLWNTDPLFVDSPNGDYHLSGSSPCIDSGTNLENIVSDMESVPIPLDGNNDGIARADMGCYEFVHPTADTDADRMKDADEIKAGTSPTNGIDYFNIDNVYSADENSETISWNSKFGKNYTVQRTDNLVQGSWSNIADYINVPGTGDTMSYSNNSPSAVGFYRVSVK